MPATHIGGREVERIRQSGCELASVLAACVDADAALAYLRLSRKAETELDEGRPRGITYDKM